MRKIFLSALLILFFTAAYGQPKIKMRAMRSRPQVHVKFGEYIVSFSITDIDKAMTFFPENEKVIYGTKCGLDSSLSYNLQLLPGRHMEYRNKLEPLLQNGVGCFLLMGGRALVSRDGKTVKEIYAKVGPEMDLNGTYAVPISFYDSRNDKLMFSGMLDSELYKKDIGFDD